MIRLKHIYFLGMLATLSCASASTWSQMKENPLIVAAGKGNLPGVKASLSKRSNVNAKSVDGITALMAASENGHEEVVEALLAAKANVNATSNDGTTALMIASQNGFHEVARMLIEAHADVNAKSNDGNTALIIASQRVTVMRYRPYSALG